MISKKEEAWSIIQPACHQDGGAPNLQQRSWARCDEDYSCRHKTSCQNQLPQLQGGHESHKTFSKSTPQNPRNQSRGGTCPTKRSLRAPLQCVPVKSKKSKFNCKFQNQNHKMFTRTNLRFNMSKPFSFVKDFRRREIIEPSSTSVRSTLLQRSTPLRSSTSPQSAVVGHTYCLLVLY